MTLFLYKIFIQDFHFDYLNLRKTELDNSFPKAQFDIPGYEIRARKSWNKYRGGLTEYVKKGVICKRIQKFETLTYESKGLSELTIAKEKWLCFSIYQPSTPENVASFFEELTRFPN